MRQAQGGAACRRFFQLPAWAAAGRQQGAQMFYKRLHRLCRHHGVNARGPARIAPVAEHDDRLLWAVELNPFAQGSHMVPLYLGSNHQGCAASRHPPQAHFDHVFGGENPVAACLEHGSAEIAMLPVEQDDFRRRQHFNLTGPLASFGREARAEEGVEEGVETRQSIAPLLSLPTMKI